ncbi:MFS transporter (plasmid) [Kozakia baliensis]|uniref:MFS transporter n=1 Tax=Kozakia baliensis TaxID=153496 RepID=UPI00345C4727
MAVSARSIVAFFASAYVLSFVDRQILSLLITPIKTQLALSDLQFALLNGLAFALLYSFLGLPIAALSDRMARPPIIVAGIVIWSIATIACGFSQNFSELFLARMGVGVGEAALVPAVYSFLADIVSRDRLGRTLALFSLGSFIGAGIAFLCGGALIGLLHDARTWHGIEPWKLCFIAVGLPGLPLAGLIACLVREPQHRTFSRSCAEYGAAWSFFKTQPTFYTLHFLGYAATAILLFSILSWMPAFFLRDRHFSHRTVGDIMGVVAIVCGCAGAYTSGRLIDALGTRGIAHPAARVGISGTLAAATLLVMAIVVPSNTLCIILFAGAFFFAAFPMPPSAIVLQQTVPKALRAQFSAVLLLCNALIGLSAGSMLIGFLDDHAFRQNTGIASSLIVVAGSSGFIAALLIYASTKFHQQQGFAIAKVQGGKVT